MGESVKPTPYYSKEDEERTLGEYVSELCAYYMAIGMSREEFNGSDRSVFDDYENAFECRQIILNRQLHLQGLYNYRAFGSIMSSLFPPKGKTKGEPYPDYPIAITEPEKKAEKKRNIIRTLEFVRNRTRGRQNA